MQQKRAGIPAQAVISVKQDKVEWLFGKLGTHAKIAGATLVVKDPFESDRFGRRVVVHATCRQVAAAAITALLFQLDLLSPRRTQLHESEWLYYGATGEKQGPFPFAKMVKWQRRPEWASKDGMRVQHAPTACWLPLWFLAAVDEQERAALPGSAAGPDAGGDVSMAEAEQLVAELNSQRGPGGMLQVAVGSPHLPSFPELCEEGAGTPEPMDYEAPLVAAEGPAAAQGAISARVLLVVDTNVLLANLAALERTCEHYTAAAADAAARAENSGGEAAPPVVEVLLMVPWVVLTELDRLKHSQRKHIVESALHALHRLRVLTSSRDAFVRLQPAGEHQQALERHPLPRSAQELRNDDMILSSALYCRATVVHDMQRAGQRCGVFLLSNDGGLAVRAQANGVRCFTAQELPRDPQALAQVRAAVTAPPKLPVAAVHDGPAKLVGQEVPDPSVPSPAGSGPHLQPGPSPSAAPVQEAAPAWPSPAVSPQAAGPPASQHAPPSTHVPSPQHAAPAGPAVALQEHQQAQAQVRDQARLAEQMQRLQLAAQQALAMQQAAAQQAQQQQAHSRAQQHPHAQQHHQQTQHDRQQHYDQQQQQQRQLAALQRAAAEAAAEPPAAQQRSASPQQESALARIAAAIGLSVDQLRLLEAVAPSVGVPLGQLVAELAASRQAEPCPPVSPQLEAALVRVLHLEQAQQAQQAQQLAQAHARQLAAAAAAGGNNGGGGLQAAQLAALMQAHAAATGGVGRAANGGEALSSPSGSALSGSEGGGGRQGSMPLRGPPLPSQQEAFLQRAASGGSGGGGVAQAGRDASLGEALVARQLAAAGSSCEELRQELRLVVEQCMAPAVQYHRQQDVGAFWLGYGDEEAAKAELPWDARATLHAVHNHETTFFRTALEGGQRVLDQGQADVVRRLERFLGRRGDRGPPPQPGDVGAAATDVQALLLQFQRTLRLPRLDGDNPDPAEVHGFVGLGSAAAALEEGVQRCTALLAVLGR